MIWVAIVLALLLAAFLLAIVTWRPEKNVTRDDFSHWIESIIRFYEDSASVAIVSKSCPVSLVFRRVGTHGDGCELLVEVVDGPHVARHRDPLVRKLHRWADDVRVLLDHQEVDSRITAHLSVDNIWKLGVGNHAARMAAAIFDSLGVPSEERFDMIFRGSQSKSRTLEAKERLDPGSLVR